MTAVQYSGLGPSKQLNEIVMLGSHDAGITSGGIRAKTQGRSIYEQAKCGVRIFDVRISGQRYGFDKAKLSAFHGMNTPDTKFKRVGGTRQAIDVTRMVGGDWGEDLDDILNDALKFVRKYDKEFFILKFDKSSNYEMILDACQKVLGQPADDRLYRERGNIALHSLKTMAGKVVCGFTPDGIKQLKNATIADGAAQVINLYGGGSGGGINGLCYYGKGGTPKVQPKKYAFSHPVEGKLRINIDKQRAILRAANAAGYSPLVMRMMYWTQTGVVRSIRNRDKMAWRGVNLTRLVDLWKEGGYNYMEDNVPSGLDLESDRNLKKYFPNFIMVDFANMHKGDTVYQLNNLDWQSITVLNQQMRVGEI